MGGGPPGSQVAPLPRDLPFRLVSKTIGCGAYASIRKATPVNKPAPVIAIKFINKDHAFRAGRLRPKQLEIELALHAWVCPHQNIIRYISHGQDANWVWLGMELAEGGDLFDKIEADEGVGEDVAHFYFCQLVNAIDWCHKKGVAHRDIKPENMLLDKGGNLKLADFGLATQFVSPRTGERKSCGMVCGSPPYIAPEIIAVGHKNQKRKNGEDKVGYDPQIADVWSCAIVLFVLLVGNTPWDAPVMDDSYEYHEYVTTKGRPTDDLWERIPAAALSLVRGLLNVEHTERLTLDQARKHPWFTRRNSHIGKKGTAADPMALATQMLTSLHINFDQPVQSSQRQLRKPQSQGGDAMDIDTDQPLAALARADFASTQPEIPMADVPFDWEAPPRLGTGFSSSQPQTTEDRVNALESHRKAGAKVQTNRPVNAHLYDLFTEDPSMSQFSATPSIPLTLTQQARQFNDIVPAHSLARFISPLKIPQLLPMLVSALHRLSIPVAVPAPEEKERLLSLRIKTMDARMQPMTGTIILESIEVHGDDGRPVEAVEVRFNKAKGDPLGWRRLFKQVTILCKDAILRPSEPKGL